MAPNKRKILEAARKFVQKGAKEKALKEYGKLIKLDPRDAKLRLEIGDAHRRWGQVDDAIAAYTKVAEQYMGEGFDARAVAVFKQIQTLDPERWASYISLADLYQRMGLTSEAVQALQIAADGLHKSGEKREALELLRRMASLDPGNTTSRIKVADLLHQEGMNGEAIAEYEAVHTELERDGEAEGAAKVLERILEIEPDRVATMSALARNLLARDLAQQAEPFVKRATEIQADETAHYELLADVYRAQGRDDELATTYRSLADVYRQRGDDDRARSILQRFVPPQDLEASLNEASQDFGPSDELLDETLLDEGELLEEELLEEIVEPEAAKSGPEPAREAGAKRPDLGPRLGWETPEALAESTPPMPEPKPMEELEPPPAGDPNQLLAEASVYLRYGKRDRAIRNLVAVLDAEPEHRGALEKLGEAHADGGNTAEAVAAWLRAAEIAHASEDADALGVLRDRVAALDPAAVAQMPVAEAAADAALEEMLAAPESSDSPGSPESPGAADEAGVSTSDADALELELEEDIEIDAPELDEDIEIDATGLDEDIEIDATGLDADLEDALGTTTADPESGPELSALDPVADGDSPVPTDFAEPGPGDTVPQLIPAADDDEASESASDEFAAAAEETPAGASASLSLTSQLSDDLEEAEFYHQQGLFDEAREIYERVLTLAPNHPLALVRMGEFAAADGAEPEASPEAERQPEVESGEALANESEHNGEPERSNDPEPGGEPELDDEPEVDPDDGVGLFVSDDQEPALGDVPVSDVTAAELSLEPTEESAGESFDLAAELSGFFDADDDSDSAASSSGVVGSEAEHEVFSAIFSEFKKGVSEQLGEADHEARYDLGIAYREMGLIEDAVGEFELVVKSGTRRLECLHLLGLCMLDLGRGEAALTQLEAALDTVDPTAQEATALRFDLGRALESLGRIPEARAAWETVADVDPSFGEVEERLAMLAQSKPEVAADDDMESFEEFFEDEDDASNDSMEAVAANPEHESFEDLIAEANVESEPEAEPAPEAAAPPDAAEPEPTSAPQRKPKHKPRRKKQKISFV